MDINNIEDYEEYDIFGIEEDLRLKYSPKIEFKHIGPYKYQGVAFNIKEPKSPNKNKNILIENVEYKRKKHRGQFDKSGGAPSLF